MTSSRFRIPFALIMTFLCLCLVAPLASAAPANQRVAKITALAGSVKVMKAGGEKTFAAFKNMGLTEGDSIITGKASEATLALDEFKDVRIGENSQVLISELRYALKEDSEQSTFSLLAGGLWGSIRKHLNLDSRFQIKTANAVMGVRGTELYVRHTENGTMVDLVEGTITVASIQPVQNPDGSTGEQVVETIMHAGQHISLDAPAAEIADFILEELTPEGLDLFALQVLEQMAADRPDLVTPAVVEQVRQLITERQAEQPQVSTPPPVQIIYDSAALPPAEPSEEEQPQIPAVVVSSIADQTEEVDQTVMVPLHISPAGATVTVSVNPTSGLAAQIQQVSVMPELSLVARTPGVYTVTVQATHPGYSPGASSFTVTVPAVNHAPTVGELRISGYAVVGRTLTAAYIFADADQHTEQGSAIQWYRCQDAGGSTTQAINGATSVTYTIGLADLGQYVFAEITPRDQFGLSGTAALSNGFGPVSLDGSAWTPVGSLSTAGSSLVDNNPRVAIKAGNDGQMFIAYIGQSGAARVWRWDGVNWTELLGSDAWYAGSLELAVDQGIPYIAYNYRNTIMDSAVYVKRYVNGQWETVNGEPVLTGNLDIPIYGFSLDVKGGVAYLALGLPVKDSHYNTVRVPTVYSSADGAWNMLGSTGLTGQLVAVKGVDIAVHGGLYGVPAVPYVAYLPLFEGDPISVWQYVGSSWTFVGSFDSGTNDQVEAFQLQFDQDGVPNLVSSFLRRLGPVVVAYTSSQSGSVGSFNTVGTVGFGEEIAQRPSGYVGSVEKIVAYENATATQVTVQRLNGDAWTHFGGAGIVGANSPAVLVKGNTVYLAYVDPTNRPHVVARPLPTGQVESFLQMAKPVWSTQQPGVITWAATVDAIAYRLQVWKGETLVETLVVDSNLVSYDLGNMLRQHESGTYAVRVRALGDGYNHADGAYSERSNELTTPVLLGSVEADSTWGGIGGTTISWQAVEHATGYRLALLNSLASEQPLYQIDVNAGVTSYDFGELLSLADRRRVPESPMSSLSYYVRVTSLGGGVFTDGQPSPDSDALTRLAAPSVTNVVLTDVGEAGNASDLRVSFESPDQSKVAAYHIVLRDNSDTVHPGIGDLTQLPATRYQVVGTGGSLPVDLRADLLTWDGKQVEEGASYSAYVVTVPNNTAQIFACSLPSNAVTPTSEVFHVTKATASVDGSAAFITLNFNQNLDQHLAVLEADDFVVKRKVAGAEDVTMTGIVPGLGTNTINISFTDDLFSSSEPLPYAVSYEVKLNTPAKVAPAIDGTLLAQSTWLTQVVDRYPASVSATVVNSNLNQVVLQFADTPVEDRFNLRVSGVPLLQPINLRSYLANYVNAVLSAYYSSDGKLVINLRDADTGNYAEFRLGFLIQLIDTELELKITDTGGVWQAELAEPEQAW